MLQILANNQLDALFHVFIYLFHFSTCFERSGYGHCATSRTVPGSIPGGVIGDFFRGTPDRTMCPEVHSASESEYQGFLLG